MSGATNQMVAPQMTNYVAWATGRRPVPRSGPALCPPEFLFLPDPLSQEPSFRAVEAAKYYVVLARMRSFPRSRHAQLQGRQEFLCCLARNLESRTTTESTPSCRCCFILAVLRLHRICCVRPRPITLVVCETSDISENCKLQQSSSVNGPRRDRWVESSV